MRMTKSCFLLFWIILLCPLVSCCAGGRDHHLVYLTWQHDPTTTMTVQWVSDVKSLEDDVYYRREGDPKWEIAVGTHRRMPKNEPYLIHQTELTNLTPGESYIFKTGTWEDPDRKFRTMPSELKSPVRFVVGGDMYHNRMEYLVETNRQAANTDPHFALVGGDIAYAGNKLPGKSNPDEGRRWLGWITAWSQHMITPGGYLIPMIPTIGNHDVNGRYNQTPEQAQYYYALFAFPGMQGYNVLDFGRYMSVIALDTAHTHPISGAQTLWLQGALERRRSVPYKFAFYHVPAYPSVRKFKGEYSAQVREHWVPIFEKFGLTTAFEHHDHVYKRTHPIFRGKVDQDGVLYLGDGSWAVKRPRQPKKPRDIWYLAKTAGSRHFILVTLDGSKRTYTAIDPKGKILDSYSQVPALILQ